MGGGGPRRPLLHWLTPLLLPISNPLSSRHWQLLQASKLLGSPRDHTVMGTNRGAVQCSKPVCHNTTPRRGILYMPASCRHSPRLRGTLHLPRYNTWRFLAFRAARRLGKEGSLGITTNRLTAPNCTTARATTTISVGYS